MSDYIIIIMPHRGGAQSYMMLSLLDRLNEGIAIVHQNKNLPVGFPSKRDRLWLGQWGASVVWPGDLSFL